MKILLSSYFFAPSIGGIETASMLLATAFVEAGHEVKVITTTTQEDHVARPFEVIRDPAPAELVQLSQWCDVFYQNNLSLRLAWPLFFMERPLFITHATWVSPLLKNPFDVNTHLRRWLLRRGVNIAPSRAVADSFFTPGIVIGNPYRDEIFKLMPGVERKTEVAYLGRLVSDKGVNLLIQAVAKLRGLGISPRLTIIGSGPDESALRKLVVETGVENQVVFTGAKKDLELARLLNEHQVLVVPSRWAEPFGIVALEGIACGCAVIGSQDGGLAEAIGPCGLTFVNGDVNDLAEKLRTVLTQPDLRTNFAAAAAPHLKQFKSETVAEKYLQTFASGRPSS